MAIGLTLKEAAELADMSPVTLRVQINKGRIHAEKKGPIWLISRRSLRAYCESVGRPFPSNTYEIIEHAS